MTILPLAPLLSSKDLAQADRSFVRSYRVPTITSKHVSSPVTSIRKRPPSDTIFGTSQPSGPNHYSISYPSNSTDLSMYLCDVNDNLLGLKSNIGLNSSFSMLFSQFIRRKWFFAWHKAISFSISNINPKTLMNHFKSFLIETPPVISQSQNTRSVWRVYLF